MFSKHLILFSAFTALTSALPLEPDLYPRVCGTVNLPATQIQLQQAAPGTSFPNTATTDKSVRISQDVNSLGQVINKVNSLIAFTSPPQGSYGCSLGITFPSTYAFPTLSGVSPSLNVYTVAEPLPSSPTWNNVQAGALFGTVTVTAGQSTVVNSATCGSSGLAFLFGYPDWVTGQGSVGWVEYVNGLNGAGLTGVFLSFNC